jgi:hypothetical protein
MTGQRHLSPGGVSDGEPLTPGEMRTISERFHSVPPEHRDARRFVTFDLLCRDAVTSASRGRTDLETLLASSPDRLDVTPITDDLQRRSGGSTGRTPPGWTPMLGLPQSCSRIAAAFTGVG